MKITNKFGQAIPDLITCLHSCARLCIFRCYEKQREHILLEPEQSKRLQDESDRSGAPKSEIVRRALDQYFNADDDDEWDRQMKRDAAAGRLDEIVARAKKQYKEGKYTEL